jgi:hypothetical protein
MDVNVLMVVEIDSDMWNVMPGGSSVHDEDLESDKLMKN